MILLFPEEQPYWSDRPQVQGPIADCSGLLSHLFRTLSLHCAGLYLAPTQVSQPGYRHEKRVLSRGTEGSADNVALRTVHPVVVNTTHILILILQLGFIQHSDCMVVR